MSRANDPAYPIPIFQRQDGYLDLGQPGLTIREHFAALAMRALASTDLYYGTVGKPESPWPWVTEQAVKAADALIAELAKPVKP